MTPSPVSSSPGLETAFDKTQQVSRPWGAGEVQAAEMALDSSARAQGIALTRAQPLRIGHWE